MCIRDSPRRAPIARARPASRRVLENQSPRHVHAAMPPVRHPARAVAANQRRRPGAPETQFPSVFSRVGRRRARFRCASRRLGVKERVRSRSARSRGRRRARRASRCVGRRAGASRGRRNPCVTPSDDSDTKSRHANDARKVVFTGAKPPSRRVPNVYINADDAREVVFTGAKPPSRRVPNVYINADDARKVVFTGAKPP